MGKKESAASIGIYCWISPMAGITVSTWVWSTFSTSPLSNILMMPVNKSFTSWKWSKQCIIILWKQNTVHLNYSSTLMIVTEYRLWFLWSIALLRTEHRLRLLWSKQNTGYDSYEAQLCCKQNTGYDCYGANRIQAMIVVKHSSAPNRTQAMIVMEQTEYRLWLLWSTALLQTEYRLWLYGAQLCCKQNTGYDCMEHTSAANRIKAISIIQPP